MYKIKLLILLLTSLIFFQSCSKSFDSQTSYSLEYIPGGVDGLILKNFLFSHLDSSGIYNASSNFKINAKIKHNQDLFITNINNTSDRELIESRINITIYDQLNNCSVFQFEDNVDQFFVIASTQNFTSNNKAIEEIKSRNTEILVQNFIFELISNDFLMCLNEQ